FRSRAGRALRLLHGGPRGGGPRAPRQHAAAQRAAGTRGARRQSVPLRQPRPRDPRRAQGCRHGRSPMISRRGFLAAGSALIVGLGLEGPERLLAQTVANDRFLGKPLSPDLVDSYLAVHADGTVTLFTGKV